MPVIHAPDGPTHELGSTRFTSLATPTRGSGESSVWQVEIEPGTPPTPHSVTREEVFVLIEGAARVRLGGRAPETARPGDAVVVPAGVRFEISPLGAGCLRMICCLPVGGQARTEDGALFTPPWAQ